MRRCLVLQVALHFSNIWMKLPYRLQTSDYQYATVAQAVSGLTQSSVSSQSGKLTPEASNLAHDTRREGTETPDAGM